MKKVTLPVGVGGLAIPVPCAVATSVTLSPGDTSPPAPPLLKSLMTSRSPSLWRPLKLKPPPLGVDPRVILFWKNQNPCWASPLLSKRSDPKYSTSQVGAPPVGQFGSPVGLEYLAAKL